MAKIKMKLETTIAEHFESFLLEKRAQGVRDTTISAYRQHLSAISKHLNIDVPTTDLSKHDLEQMIISMRESTLAHNSISSYAITLKAFLSWCNTEGITNLNMKRYKREETIKDTYTTKSLRLCSKSLICVNVILMNNFMV